MVSLCGAARNQNTMSPVRHDVIACPDSRASNRVVLGIVNPHPIVIAERWSVEVLIGADDISLHYVIGRSRFGNLDPRIVAISS